MLFVLVYAFKSPVKTDVLLEQLFYAVTKIKIFNKKTARQRRQMHDFLCADVQQAQTCPVACLYLVSFMQYAAMASEY